jgi:hypothetical protein
MMKRRRVWVYRDEHLYQYVALVDLVEIGNRSLGKTSG